MGSRVRHTACVLAVTAVLAAGPGCDDGAPTINGVAPPDTIECHTCSDTSFCPWPEHSMIHSDDSPAWSPDGRTIAFTRTCPIESEIWLMRAGGTEQGYLTNGDYADWSPDGSRIAFEFARDIYVITLSDSSIERLTVDGALTCPRWSPDGGRISYVCIRLAQRGVWVMESTGADPEWLLLWSGADWSPDGHKMVYQDLAPDSSGAGLWILDLDTRETTPVSDGVVMAGYGDPRWSPDGRLFAWTVNWRMGEIWLASTECRDLCRLHKGGASAPAWSPDGQSLAFVRRLPGHLPGYCTKTIWTMRANGDDCTQITFPPDYAGKP